MGSTQFVLALHNHQPVGNFENVFREAFEKCYDPFLHFLEEHPSFRVCLHYSGCLFDWLEGREKRFLRRLERLVRENQIEILGGGYYEPILSLIPERDAIGQVRAMNQYVRRRFGKPPQGFWLTERVWEQKIPRLVAQAGLRYTALDDTHFALAGMNEREIRNFFITEEENAPLFVFPIPKFLRYAIPFREPEEALSYIRRQADSSAGLNVVTYADDGEKFGLWPGTYQWVYRDGWLDRFARSLEENRTWLDLTTFGEVVNCHRGQPVPRVYLPSASYEEMMDWCQNPEKANEFHRLKRELTELGLWERARVFFQGGTFKNFLAKYSEAHWMVSRMRAVSRAVNQLKSPAARKKAGKELWQAQCNCPYWHGVFGGLYLHHLRRTTYSHLIQAEGLQGSRISGAVPQRVVEDLNQDGADEIIVKSFPFSFYFLPYRGGSLMELDFHPEVMNVLDVMTRRKEAYHRELASGAKEGGRSIHELAKSVPTDVEQRMAFDSCDRVSFIEHFLVPEANFEEFRKGCGISLEQEPHGSFFEEKKWTCQGRSASLALGGRIGLGSAGDILVVEKQVRLQAGQSLFDIIWNVKNESPHRIECLWGSEWNFNFFDHERIADGIQAIEIQDGWSPVHLKIAGETPFNLWQFPIETVSQTESEFRLMHQGICVFPHWRISLEPGQKVCRRLTFSFSSRC